MSESKSVIPAPFINVTPLIDVLLVLLIIFMVAAPLKPHRFLAKVPTQAPVRDDVEPDPLTLVVTIEADRTLKLNRDSGLGTVDDFSALNARLISTFAERLKHLPANQRLQKTVFIKAARSITYGEVARVMDGLKGSGADPIGLQLDDLK